MKSFPNQIINKKVLVFGLGLQGGGHGDALWLNENGAKVRVTDMRAAKFFTGVSNQLPSSIEQVYGEHRIDDIDWADIILRNPAVPTDHPLLVHAHSKGKYVTSSMAEFGQANRDKIIGITGTRGKSTTTELIYQILSTWRPGEVTKGGNIPGTSALKLFDYRDKISYFVLELSSFQLHDFHTHKISPHIAVFTNLYPDHLNRYSSMESYAKDKTAIYAYQGTSDHLVLNAENESVLKLAESAISHKHLFRASDVDDKYYTTLTGSHNLENIAAAVSVAQILNIDDEHVKSIIADFHGLPYRLEKIATIKGVNYINDTTSTTPIATITAIKSLQSPTVLILGGESKNLPIEDLIDTIANSPQIRQIIILGSKNNQAFIKALSAACITKIAGFANSMKEAVELATTYTEVGDTVLLSPGFASFDLFKNEFDRGREFSKFVKELAS